MAQKKYVSLSKLQTFLNNLSGKFASLIHTHKLSDITDYTVDNTLSSTSVNPVQNKVLDAEFEAVSTAMNALESAVDGKADSAHNHDDLYYTETEVDNLITNVNTSVSSIYETKTDATAKLTEAKTHTDEAVSTRATAGHGIYYGTCDSSASSIIKTVTLTDSTGFSLAEGTVVIVKFKYSNSATNPMMNVNTTGAKYMKRQGTIAIPASSASYGWQLGAVQIFVYDGENWVRDYWYNSTYSNFSLGHGYGTCDTEETTLEKAVTTTGLTAVTGGFLAIKFTNAVPANSTLKINSSDSKEIYYNGVIIPDGIIGAGDTATFVYDDVFHLIAVNKDTYSKTEIDTTVESLKDYADSSSIPIVNMASEDGAIWTATIDNVENLTAGMTFLFVPNRTSSSTTLTLNVNGFGDVAVRRKLSSGTATLSNPTLTTQFFANRPVLLMYDTAMANGTPYWIALEFTKPSASDIYGKVPVQNGGWYSNANTTDDDLVEAREAFGVYSKADHELTMIYDSGEITEAVNSISGIDISGYNNIHVLAQNVNDGTNTTSGMSGIVFTATNGTAYLFPAWSGFFHANSGKNTCGMAHFKLMNGWLAMEHGACSAAQAKDVFDETEGGSALKCSVHGGGAFMRCTNELSTMALTSSTQSESLYFGVGSRVMVWGCKV